MTKLRKADTPWMTDVVFSLGLRQIGSLVYNVSLLRLDEVLHELMHICHDHLS